jgi:hypothetical protein
LPQVNQIPNSLVSHGENHSGDGSGNDQQDL